MQADLYANPCKIRQRFKNIKNIYGHLPPKKIAELILWDSVNVDLIVPYRKSIRQHLPGGAIINNNVSLACMTMIKPATGWLEIVKIPMYNLDEVTGVNDEYLDKYSFRVIQLFNNTWISRYPCT